MGEPIVQPPQYVALDQVQDLIEQALQKQQAQHEQQLAQAQAQASATVPEGSVSAAQVNAIVEEALSRQAEAHNKSLQALAMSMRGSVASLVPAHSGGPGTEIAETWSQYEQELSHQKANQPA